ncbi:heme exporter protein CcmB [Halocola ammonii]
MNTFAGKLVREITYLIKNEALLELRQKYVFGGILLYVFSTIFVCYLSFRQIVDIPTWNALLWIILLFTAFNAIGKSFDREGRGLQIYLYTLARPQSVILAKILYNMMVMTVLTAISIVIYSMFIGNSPLEETDFWQFALALFLGALGFASSLTLVSGIAAKTDNNMGMMAILGFPVILPLLMSLMRFSKNAIDGIAWELNYKYALTLGGINLIVLALSYLLFPYLWRE